MHLTRRLIENVKVIFKILKSNQLACLKWMAAAVFCGSYFFLCETYFGNLLLVADAAKKKEFFCLILQISV